MFNSTPFQLVLRSMAAVVALVLLTGAKGRAHDAAATFVPIEVPGARLTAARGITADGRIVGFFDDANGRRHGFLLADGTFTTIDAPDASSTVANGINPRGDIVGAWVDGSGATHGYLLPAYGSFTVIDVEDATLTTAFGINAAGDIVGQYDTSEKRHGYVRSRAGVFTSIDLPNTVGPSPFGTSAFSINQRGHTVGSYFDGAVHGYVMKSTRHRDDRAAPGIDAFASDGTVTQLDVPFPGGVSTQARGINARGDIVGSYVLGSRTLSFRRDRHGNYESLEAPTAAPAPSTFAFGINARGDIVGTYTEAGVTRGFVIYRTRTPK